MTSRKRKRRFRLFVDRITSVGAVPVGDNPGAEILFSKRRTPRVNRDHRAKVARVFTMPLVRGGAEPAAAIERALRMGGPGAAALRDVLALDGSPDKFAAELAAQLKSETTKETKPMPTNTTKTKKERPETVQERIERAVRRAAMFKQATERGQLSVPGGVLRAEIWQSETGRELVAVMRKSGHEDAFKLHKSALSPDQGEAWDFVEQWAK